jgi:AhpD family alkylhydroperoxidase
MRFKVALAVVPLGGETVGVMSESKMLSVENARVFAASEARAQAQFRLCKELLLNWLTAAGQAGSAGYPAAKTQKGGLMQPRLDFRKASPAALKAVQGLEEYLSHCSLEPNLIHLLKMRASQINGCAYCIDMHSKDLRANGESEQRIYALDAWRETPFFSERERAALAWTEAVTLVSKDHVPDEVFEELRKHFSDAEVLDLTLAVATINLWNRIAIPLRAVPGHYKPVAHKVAV